MKRSGWGVCQESGLHGRAREDGWELEMKHVTFN